MSIDFAAVLSRMVEDRASDVHLSPGVAARDARPRADHADGRLREADASRTRGRSSTRSSTTRSASASRTSASSTSPTRFPGVARFRVNVFFQRGAISAAFRLIPSEIQTSTSLGLPAVLAEFMRKPRGFVLVTGPTGSGKSTTLASMVDLINPEREEHILTIEDPIEFLHAPQELHRQPARDRRRRDRLRHRR